MSSQVPATEPPVHAFSSPVKKIEDGRDVSHFLQTKAYGDIMSFLLQLNRAMFPCREIASDGTASVRAWPTNAENVKVSPIVMSLSSLLDKLAKMVFEVPPDPGPRRFGNVAFRTWYQKVEVAATELFTKHLSDLPDEAQVELIPYFLGSFGSAQRLDYGSGHELSFLAFLGCIWKLGGFFPAGSIPSASLEEDNERRGIVIGVLQPYFTLIRQLIMTYTLEPAGSHGVWGLDDHSFIPYILGSAQLGPARDRSSPGDQAMPPMEGSLDGAPDPGDVASAEKTARYKDSNIYFSAIHFIHEVKKGPFWEHSPMLYDISGVRGGWAKINKGMLKMYNAEVLGKFPVVQHFPFGSLFSWDKDPNAPAQQQPPPSSVHLASQPTQEAAPKSTHPSTKLPTSRSSLGDGTDGHPTSRVPSGMSGTRAPWATPSPTSTASATTARPPPPGPPTRAPLADRSSNRTKI